MTPKMEREKSKEECGDDPCSNPAVGKDRIVAYIAGEMTEAEHQEFVGHVAECKHCLEEVVLWRTAEELVEREDQPEQKVSRSA